MELKRALRMRALVASAAGLAVASSGLVATVQVLTPVGDRWAWLAVLIAGVLCIMAAWNFGELAGAFPTAGGVQVYVREAFGPTLALTVTLMYVVLALAAGAAEAYIFGSVLAVAFGMVPFLAHVPLVVWVVASLTFFLLVNIRGVELAGRVQEILTWTMVVAMIGMAVAAFESGHPAAQPAHRLSLPGFVQAAAYSVYLYIGFEWITPLAEEAQDRLDLPRAMPAAVGVLALSYGLFTTAMGRVVPLAALRASPTPHLLLGQALAGQAGLWVLIAISALATFTSFNAGMLGYSRIVYAMAREGVLPRFLAKIHLTYFTPWAALVTMFSMELVLAVAVVYTRAFTVPILLAAAIEAMIYALIAAAVLRLRQTKPDLERPFRAPGGGFAIAVTGAAFAVLAIGTLVPPSPPAVSILLAAGLLLAFLYARYVPPRLRNERSGLAG